MIWSYEDPLRPDELAHYGVLGMKWGQHRAAQKGKDYTYKSFGTRHNDWKAAKAYKKSNRLLSKSAKAFEAGKDKKGSKLAAKADKQMNNRHRFERRADRSREMDRFEQKRAEGKSTGMVIGQRAALTMIGIPQTGMADKSYAQYQAISKARGKDTNDVVTQGKSLAMAWIGGRAGSVAAKTIHIRQGEKDYINSIIEDRSRSRRS